MDQAQFWIISVIGPAILTDDRGTTFVNPLATFDGCFGTL